MEDPNLTVNLLVETDLKINIKIERWENPLPRGARWLLYERGKFQHKIVFTEDDLIRFFEVAINTPEKGKTELRLESNYKIRISKPRKGYVSVSELFKYNYGFVFTENDLHNMLDALRQGSK